MHRPKPGGFWSAHYDKQGRPVGPPRSAGGWLQHQSSLAATFNAMTTSEEREAAAKARLEAYITKVVDAAPPLTSEQPRG
jgi:hypothetical protein